MAQGPQACGCGLSCTSPGDPTSKTAGNIWEYQRNFSFLLRFSLFTNGVKEAYLDSRLFDVRLLCADGLIFWAHSLVLSVFSDFFAEMARLNLKEINLGDANSG